jgi:hypothetical protein
MPPTPRPCDVSQWQDEKEKRNRLSIARLTRPLPDIYPSNVLSRALNRPAPDSPACDRLVMRTDTSLHADQARRHIGQPCFDLASRDHLRRSTMAPRPFRPTTWNEFLPISMPMTPTALLDSEI